jgi:hypothetical protein
MTVSFRVVQGLDLTVFDEVANVPPMEQNTPRSDNRHRG